MNERDCPQHGLSCHSHQAAFDHSLMTCLPSTANGASNRGEASDGTTMSSTTCGTAFQSLRTQMPSANGSAVSDCATAGRAGCHWGGPPSLNIYGSTLQMVTRALATAQGLEPLSHNRTHAHALQPCRGRISRTFVAERELLSAAEAPTRRPRLPLPDRGSTCGPPRGRDGSVCAHAFLCQRAYPASLALRRRCKPSMPSMPSMAITRPGMPAPTIGPGA